MWCDRKPDDCYYLNEMVTACSTDWLHSTDTVHKYKIALVECICDSESDIQCTCRKKIASTLKDCVKH